MTFKERIAAWVISRRIRKFIEERTGRSISRREFKMLKSMFIDNWFSTLIGLVASANELHTNGLSWKAALYAALGIILRDAVPGLGKIFGKGGE